MPRYEFRCRACGSTFEVSRPMSEAGAPAGCPAGHDDTVKLLSTVALGGTGGPGDAGRGAASASVNAGPPAGGCCGGGCCG